MNSILAAGAAILTLTLGTLAASAMPRTSTVESGSAVVNVQIDCHPDVRRHYLPEYGRRVWHRHRQPSCRIVLVDPEFEERPRDCHRDIRRHYLPEYGRSLYHKHVGERCRIRVYDRYEGGGSGGNSCVKIGPLTLCESRDY